MELEEVFQNYKGKKFRYLRGKGSGGIGILLMHGYSFYAEIWKECGLLDSISNVASKFVSLDVPGFPKSKSRFNLSGEEFVDFLDSLIKMEFGYPPVVLGSSASGFLALNYASVSKNLSAVIAVDPVNINEVDLHKINVPILGIWGELDKISDPSNASLIGALKNGKTFLIKGAGHACYLDKSAEFNKIIVDFLKSVQELQKTEK
ncbi:MAG: alpha/beta hydrolase [Thermoplasmatales archaeon]